MDTSSGLCGAGVTSGCDRARAAFVACMNHGPLLHVLAQASEEANDDSNGEDSEHVDSASSTESKDPVDGKNAS